MPPSWFAELPSPTCSLDKNLNGLQPGTDYVLAVAAVNAQGQMSNYTETAFQTAAQPAVRVSTVAAVQPAAPALPAPAPVASIVPTPVAAPHAAATATPRATASPGAAAIASASPSASASESGAVKSATTAKRNWTPWIVLGVLIGLAVLATAGYFYWFGGEAGAAVDAAATPVRPTPKDDASVSKPEDRPTKRW